MQACFTFVILCLLQLEDVMYKELLQLLVAKVDAELLKGVGLKSLKAKDVQHPNAETLLALFLLGKIAMT